MKTDSHGFTLIELMMALAVLSLLLVIAIPSYDHSINRARVSQAIGDIKRIEGLIERYRTQHFRLPPNLGVLNAPIPADPWGRPYVYLNIEAGVSLGQVRKDKSMVPVNSDYDLYSVGRDGETVAPFTAKRARDDIVRAGNGAYIGLAKDH